jgi:hypothetical protein
MLAPYTDVNACATSIRLRIRVQQFLLLGVGYSTRGKPGDLGGEDTRPPLARGDGVNKRRLGVKGFRVRWLLIFKRVSSSAGDFCLY